MRKLIFTMLAATLMSSAAIAEMTERDIQVAARTFGFVNGIPAGSVVVAIVHDPANAASKAEADKLNGLLGGGLKVAKHTLTSKLVAVSGMDLSGAIVAIVTDGLESSHSTISSAASAAKVMTLTSDFGCVDAKQCVMGVTSAPGVKIQISQSAANSASLEFSQALKLMVTESD